MHSLSFEISNFWNNFWIRRVAKILAKNTNLISDLLIYIAGTNKEDTDSMMINGTGNFNGKLTLNFGFSTSGIDPLTAWAVLGYYGKSYYI